MPAVSVSDYANLLRSLYPTGVPENLAVVDNPGFGILPKSTNFVGDYWKVRMLYGDGAGRSATIANAVSSSAAVSAANFNMTRMRDFAEFLLDLEAMESSMGVGADAELLQTTVDAKINRLGASLGHACYRDGTGSLCQVTDVASVPVLQCVDPDDLKHIQVGDVLASSNGSTKTAATRAAGTNTMTVTAKDENAGTFTVGAGITGLADNDWLFIAGDRQAAQITAHSMMKKIAGFDAWLDGDVGALTAADAFYGTTRSTDSKLLGVLLAPTIPYATVSQGLVDIQSHVNSRPGAKVDNILVNPIQLRKLKEEVDIKTSNTKMVKAMMPTGTKAVVSYQGIVIDGDKGPITVLSDSNCPNGLGYALTTKSWEFKSLHEAPRFMNPNGAKDILRQINTISFEGVLGYFGNMACKAPCWNGRVVLPT
jgi:hypothetical protein